MNDSQSSDDQLLQDIGLGSLSDEEKQKAQDTIAAALEERVGERMANQLNGDQMTQFEKFIQEDNPDEAVKWLHEQVPNSEQIVNEELEKLKNDVKTGGLAALGDPDAE